MKILDSRGELVGAEFVPGRITVHLIVPIHMGARNEFRLHLDGGGKETPSDARVLNFRVFKIDVS